MRVVAPWSLMVVLSACGLGLPSTADTASGLVGTQGGKVTTPAGVSVEVPAGALSSSITLWVGPPSATQPHPASAKEVGTLYAFGPEGTAFAVPATVTLEVGALPAGKAMKDVVVLRANAESAAFERLVTTVVDATHVSAQTHHFSVFVPVIDEAAGQDGGTDGGTDGGPNDGGPATCVESCSGSASANTDAGFDGGADCACTSTCGATTVELLCSGTSPLGCACVVNGQQVSTVQLSYCPGPGSVWSVCGLAPSADGGVVDGGPIDGGPVDAGPYDGGYTDGGYTDGGYVDGGYVDGGVADGGSRDGGTMVDAGAPDAGMADGGLVDAGP